MPPCPHARKRSSARGVRLPSFARASHILMRRPPRAEPKWLPPLAMPLAKYGLSLACWAWPRSSDAGIAVMASGPQAASAIRGGPYLLGGDILRPPAAPSSIVADRRYVIFSNESRLHRQLLLAEDVRAAAACQFDTYASVPLRGLRPILPVRRANRASGPTATRAHGPPVTFPFLPAPLSRTAL